MTIKYLALALSVASANVYAEDEAIKLWSGDVDFGYTNLTGNTEESTMAGKVSVTRENKPWKWDVIAESLFSETEDDRTAEKYMGFTRLAYNFTEKNYVFGRATYETDKFSGYDYQSTLTAGVGWNLYDLETLDWDLEAGAGYRSSKVEDPATGEDEDEPIVTLSTLVDWQFSENASFKQYLSYEKGDESDIAYSRSELKVQVIGALAMKLSYNVKYQSEVPEGSEDTDTETIVSVTYSF
ncbi:DUF481 domain-containing protein [Thalassotalea sp. Y01]|uniref:DUF481 domain-containing protein n=1 Tax=Thalassotalea sp. Y01 TaxID=2729613 RepID=UPI00145F5701|nr:DUF481 domain-containing protein [Thalassotalea sp. Y01]NMP15762.1 DUF481 domain-containing protein [Thalassotalea sp. Y01]